LRLRADVVAVDVALEFVRQQDVDQIAFFGGFGSGHGLEAVADCQIVVGTTGALSDEDIAAAVPQILSLSVALTSVTDNRDRFALQMTEIGIVFVINLDRHSSESCETVKK